MPHVQVPLDRTARAQRLGARRVLCDRRAALGRKHRQRHHRSVPRQRTWIATIVGIQPGAEGLSSEATAGIAIALAIAWALFNVQRITTLAWFNVGFAAFELALAVILGVTLFALRPPQGGASMWSEWTNGSGFAGVDGYVVLLSLSMAMYSLSAYDVSPLPQFLREPFRSLHTLITCPSKCRPVLTSLRRPCSPTHPFPSG